MSRLIKLLVLLLVSLPLASFAQNGTSPKPTTEVQKLIDKGEEAARRYDWETAATAYEQAMSQAKRQLDATGEAQALNHIGFVYRNIGQLPKAFSSFQQALTIYQKINDPAGRAATLNHLGNAHNSLGQPQKALEFYQQALKINREISDRNGEASTLNNFGNIYYGRNEFQKALVFYLQALPLYERTNNIRGEGHTLRNIALIYQSMGQAEKAIRYYEQATKLRKTDDDKNREAYALNNIGTIYQSLKQTDKARDYYNQALVLYERIGDKNGQSHILSNLGSVSLSLNKPKKALEYYQKALKISREIGNRAKSASILKSIGNIYITSLLEKRLEDDRLLLSNPLQNRQRLRESALNFLAEALQINRTLGDRREQADVLNQLGTLHIALNLPKEAQRYFEEFLTLSEQTYRRADRFAQNRQAYFTSELSVYRYLTDRQIQQGQDALAFATINKTKGHTLLEQISGKNGLLTGVPVEAQETLRYLKRQYNKSSMELAAATNGEAKEQVEKIRGELMEAESKFADEQKRLLALYPGSEQKNISRTVTLSEVARFLPEKTALLEFAAIKVSMAKKVWDYHLLFVVTMQQSKPVLTVHKLMMPQRELLENAEALRSACANPTRSYSEKAKILCTQLLPPSVLNRLAGHERLLVCPDGAAWSVPFAALMLPNGKHLIEQFEIDYAYSATGAQVALTVPRNRAAKTLFALANPEFGDASRFTDTLPSENVGENERPISDPSRWAVILEKGKIKPLPGTLQEADALKLLYPELMLMTGKNAQEAQVVKALPEYRYLHFATHGVFHNTAPLQSAIVLAQPPQGSQEDGYLTAREIFDLQLNAEMAVLSACETARGASQDGEGIVGLTWALFAAGCPTQVGSQWKVSDNSTPKLMTAFYSNLKKGQGKGKALRNASLSMLKGGKHTHPYHWASFVLVGDWQ